MLTLEQELGIRIVHSSRAGRLPGFGGVILLARPDLDVRGVVAEAGGTGDEIARWLPSLRAGFAEIEAKWADEGRPLGALRLTVLDVFARDGETTAQVMQHVGSTALREALYRSNGGLYLHDDGPTASGVRTWKSPQMDALNLYLREEELQQFLDGPDYGTEFRAKNFHVPGAELPWAELVLLAYPRARPHQARVTPIALEDAVRRVNSCFSLEWHNGGAPEEQEALMPLAQEEFWRLLEPCIDLHDSAILSYAEPGHSDSLLGFWAMWHFSLLIHNARQQRCVLLCGRASD